MNDRRTRYNTVSNPPPNLAAVVKQLEKAARRHGYIDDDPKVIRGIASKGSSWYSDRGKSDEMQRFLKNEAILLHDVGRLYPDLKRADHVITCCEERTVTTMLKPEEIAERLAQLKQNKTAPPTTDTSSDELENGIDEKPGDPPSESTEHSFCSYSHEELSDLEDDLLDVHSNDLETAFAQLQEQRGLVRAVKRRRLDEEIKRIEQEAERQQAEADAVAEEALRLRQIVAETQAQAAVLKRLQEELR